jgi:hypothetical protein
MSYAYSSLKKERKYCTLEVIVVLLSGRARVEAKNIGFGRVGHTVQNLGRVRFEKLGPIRPET